MAWQINEAFLRQQLEKGIDIEFVGDDVSTQIKRYDGFGFDDLKHYRIKEIRWLEENADRYGYHRIDNIWAKLSP